MKFKVIVKDNETKEETTNVIEARKNTSMKTVVLKAVERHVENYPDPVSFMSEVKSLHREADDLEDFTEWLKQDLDLETHIVDLNNKRYYNKHRDTYTTSYDEGRNSYERAWEDQLNESDGEKDLEKYLPPYDDIVEHGNELCSDELFLEDWELEEE